MRTIDRETTVAQIVLDHPETARVFTAHRVDYCCKGKVALARVCEDRGLDVDTVSRELEAAVASVKESPDVDPRKLDVSELIERIVARHHGYLRTAFPFLEPLARKVARVHGDHDPRLETLAENFAELRASLEEHLDYEEAVLFPAMVASDVDRRIVDRELATMMKEHLEVGSALEELRRLSDDYSPPSWACTSYRTLLAELANLEDDVLRHVHLENHVLSPRFVP